MMRATEGMMQGGERTDMWLRSFHRNAAGSPLIICLPHAGGSAPFFFKLSGMLSSPAEVMVVQYPGRQERRHENLITDLDELTDALFEAISPLAERPIVLFGHSMGAIISFELARRFERTGTGTVLGIVASSRRAPTIHRPQNVYLRDDAGIIAEIESLSGTDAKLLADEEMRRLMLPVLRADYKAIETYTYPSGARVRCPIHAFVGDCDPQVTVDEARHWQEVTTGPFSLKTFSGGHFYLNNHEQIVTAALRQSVAEFAGGDLRNRSSCDQL